MLCFRLLFALTFVAVTLGTASKDVIAQDANPQEYNEKLANELGADDYGMKSYVLVILTTGAIEISDKAKREAAFAGHFSNMSALAEAKKLVVAGPFVEARPKRGLFIFNVSSLEEAEKLVKTDPAVQAGIFDYELYKIYSSAALMLVNDNHTSIQKKSM